VPRRNRDEKRKAQHGKVGKQSKRPRGWHRDFRSSTTRSAVDWLEKAA
jgi:hypothetical protein